MARSGLDTSGKTKKDKPKKGRKAPLWARLCAIFGCILMVLSGGALVTSQVLVARYAGAVETQNLFGDAAEGATKEKVSDIKGPLNILLVGIDPRDAKTAPLSDSIMVVHVTADLRDAYVFSIPRDTYVEIPPFAKTGFRGGSGKINSAMAYGSKKPDGTHDVPQGFDLLAKTVGKLTGIKKFNAGAIINFGGFKKIVDAMDGVNMTLVENFKSEHLTPEGKPRPKRQCGGCAHPYYGPQKEYKKGKQHLEGWEALDVVRQRYTVTGSDYGRQQNQQRFIRAIAEQALSKDVVTNPGKLDKVVRAAGDALIFDGGGHTIVDWALAMKNLRPDNMTLISLKGGGLGVGSNYRGEQLTEDADEFFAAIQSETVPAFLLEHPDLINKV